MDLTNNRLFSKITKNIFLIVMILLLLSLATYFIIYFKTKKTVYLNDEQLEKGLLISLYSGKTIEFIDNNINYTLYLTSKDKDINLTSLIIENDKTKFSFPLLPGEKKIINITNESYYLIQLKGYYDEKYDFVFKRTKIPEINETIIIIKKSENNITNNATVNNTEERHFFEDFEQVY